MGLIERVTALLRANVNDLIDRAENPEKMLKQLALDMENQLMQVKTQVAIAVADQQLLEKKRREHIEAAEGWRRKAELALEKGQEEMARAALERRLSHEQLAAGFGEQMEDQTAEAGLMRSNYGRLQAKLKETTAQCEALIARQRLAKTVAKAQAASGLSDGKMGRVMERMKLQVMQTEAENAASRLLEQDVVMGDGLEESFRRLEREERVSALLEEIKARKGLPGERRKALED